MLNIILVFQTKKKKCSLVHIKIFRFSFIYVQIVSICLFFQEVQEELVSAWLACLTSQPRATPLIPKDHRLITTLEETLSRYLKDVKITGLKADKR